MDYVNLSEAVLEKLI